MGLLEDLLSTLDFSAPVRDIRLGLFHSAVVTRHCGLAATLPLDVIRQGAPAMRGPGFLLEKTAGELAGMARSSSLLEAVVGMAAVNSLLEVDEDGLTEMNAAELIRLKGEGRNVAVVGRFPFLARLRGVVRRLWVIEKNPGKDDFPESYAETLIPQADVVAITGTALTNHTLERLLALCRPGAYVLMLGDSVPLSPVLFDYGVDALAGTRVVDAGLVLRCISQGASFRQIRGTRRLILHRPAGVRTGRR